MMRLTRPQGRGSGHVPLGFHDCGRGHSCDRLAPKASYEKQRRGPLRSTTAISARRAAGVTRHAHRSQLTQ